MANSFQKKQYIFLSLLLFSTLILFGCGSAHEVYHEKYTMLDSDRGKTSVSFETREDGEIIKWKAVFRDDELAALYKDSERIPKAEFNKYEDMIDYKLNKLRGEKRHFTFNFDGFDKELFKEKMKEFKKNFKMHKHEWDFDKQEFEGEMQKLKEELSKLKDIEINAEFDEDEFNKGMKELKRSLKEMKIKIPKIHIDMDGVRHSIRIPKHLCDDDEFADIEIDIPDVHIDNLRDIDIPEINIPDIDIPEINIDLSGLEESMEELEHNMKNLDVEMKELDAFVEEMKNEMVKDNLIKNADDEVKIKLSKEEMKVDGKKVSDELHKKYKDLYKKHFDKELDDDNHFNIN
ncbi:MAG: hypothetical protein C4539_13645 [Ignavibacteriales bacterium]|nr:MAG: hypothetical protein C4539_13645 [Ignavibacteriales bacterium]